MFTLLWLVPAIPLAGYLINALAGARMPRTVVSIIGVGTVGISAVLTLLIGATYLSAPSPGNVFIQQLWTWISVGSFTPQIAFQLDALSLLMMVVVTFVGFVIHLYSTDYMADDPDYSRFFAYMNLFVSSMLILVMADNLLLLYLGWEGVGLSSYLLIGFWYKNPDNGRAARKAFVVTRVGDTAMGIALFMLFMELGTLTIRDILAVAPERWAPGSGTVVAIALLLLGGAVGKSGQLPLQTWLPDAMAGPTPVSALIHAATMVTAGVYLIARMHTIFTLAPVAMMIVGIVGALTLLLAGFSALTQTDIKRALAYSTISQIGYMFLALGVGAFSSAMFHFFTHAFFKALLFLAAGVVILGVHHEQNMFLMGGVRKRMPAVYWTFLIGAASLAAVPLVTAGFYSKDAILWEAWSSPYGSFWFWLAGLIGAFITGIYTFRMVFVTFFGEPHHAEGHAAPEAHHEEYKPSIRAMLPLVVLAFFSIVAGFLEIPRTLGGVHLFSEFMRPVLSPVEAPAEPGTGNEVVSQVLAALLALGGIAIAYLLYLKNRPVVDRLTERPAVRTLRDYWRVGWGFDWLYDHLFVRPYVWFARVNKNDVIDLIYLGIAALIRGFFYLFRTTQTGRLRWYAAGIVFGAALMIALVVML